MVNTISLDCNFPNARMYASPSREVLRFFLTFTPPLHRVTNGRSEKILHDFRAGRT